MTLQMIYSRLDRVNLNYLMDHVIKKQTDFYRPLTKVGSKTFKHLSVAHVAENIANTVDANMLVHHMFSTIKSRRQL